LFLNDLAEDPVVSGAYRTALQDTVVPGVSEKIVAGERVFVSFVGVNVRFVSFLLIGVYADCSPEISSCRCREDCRCRSIRNSGCWRVWVS